MKINLASGNRKRDGWLNVDISPDCKPDVVMDLLKFPWPWKSNSVTELNCWHFLEHIGDEFLPFMDECWRICKPGAKFTIQGPYYTSVRTWQDPTHKRALSEQLFMYFDAPSRKLSGVDHYPIKANFKTLEIEYLCGEELKKHSENQEKFEWMRKHLWNIVQDFNVTLEAVK